MANCEEYQKLLPKERTEYLGEIIHACISDSKFFEIGQKIRKQAKRNGLLDGVAIHPDNWDNVPPDENHPPY